MRSSRMRTLVPMLFVALAVVLPAVAGCSGSEPAPESGSDTALENAGPKEVLQSFWEATRKSGSYNVHVTDPNSEPYDSEAVFTFDGSVFRIDYQADSIAQERSIISTDGARVFLVFHEDKNARQAQTPPSYYVSLFSKPDAKLQDQGVDSETGAQKYYFLMEETYTEASEAKPWFEKDRTYFVKDDKLVRLVTRGGPESAADSGEYITHEFTFGEVDLEPEIDEGLFEIDYPIAE